MDEKIKEVIDKYELDIKNVYRARGAYMLETTDGLKILREFRSTNQKAEFAQQVKEGLRDRGFVHTDLYVRNQEGELVSENVMGNRYVLKNWFVGEECNLRDMAHVSKAAENLGELHKCLKGILPEPISYPVEPIPTTIEKHNRELRRVRTYIREKKQRNEFELLFLSLFSEFYEEAEEAEALLKDISCQEIYEKMEREQSLCHGSYNYHNIIFTSDNVATTSFEKAQLGPQIMDLYDFIRKVMEKNSWNESFLEATLSHYEKILPLSQIERQVIYVWMVYPEKFWKVTNYYYNSKKTWISSKNIEKLQGLQQQRSQRRSILRKMQNVLGV